ncbi:MAG: spore cortex-lytic enzyme [Acutalibacteraceae bacterium]
MTKKSKINAKKAWQTFIIILLNILIISLIAAYPSTEVLSKYGYRGAEVKKIQQVLKNKGYYNGEVDGIYGTGTKNAVIQFQRASGLSADGIVGTATLKALGISASSSYSSSDYYLLARLISAEARGESYTGQVAVGAVVLNRTRHSSFPNTVSGVIYQSGAFTCITDGQWGAAISDSAYKAATDAMNGWDPSGGAIYYYNPKTAVNQWIRSRPVIVTIGNHIFCS